MGALSVVFGVPEVGSVEVRERLSLRREEPLLLTVVRGLIRVKAATFNADMGPCTMLYLPASETVEIEPLSASVRIYLLPSYDMGSEPRLLHTGFTVKTPDGRAVTCFHIAREHVKLLLPAELYVVKGEVVVVKGGVREVVRDRALLEPPVELTSTNGKSIVVAILGLKS